MNEEKTVRVWIIPQRNNTTIRVATIEQNGRNKVNCKGCSAPCCKGSLMPILTEMELKKKKFKFKFVESPDWLKKQVPRAQYIAVVDVDSEKGCPYHDSITNKCSLWPNCPESCLSYDCRLETREDIKLAIRLGKDKNYIKFGNILPH